MLLTLVLHSFIPLPVALDPCSGTFLSLRAFACVCVCVGRDALLITALASLNIIIIIVRIISCFVTDGPAGSSLVCTGLQHNVEGVLVFFLESFYMHQTTSILLWMGWRGWAFFRLIWFCFVSCSVWQKFQQHFWRNGPAAGEGGSNAERQEHVSCVTSFGHSFNTNTDRLTEAHTHTHYMGEN